MTKRFLILLTVLALLQIFVAVAESSPPPRFSLLAAPGYLPTAGTFPPASLLPAAVPNPFRRGSAAGGSIDEATEFPLPSPPPGEGTVEGQNLLLARQVDQAPSAGIDRDTDHQWKWRRAGMADYAAIVVSAIGTLYVENEHGEPDAKWTARNDFDEGIRDALRLESRSARDAANDAGTAVMGLMLAAPILDSFASLGIRDSNWDALWQTEIINAEAFTFAGTVSSLLQNLIIPRERPFVRNCQAGKCEDHPLNRSMPSGHAAFAFTGAGLVCTHHEFQSLYGDPAADRAACFTGIGMAIAEGFLRVVADRHYATDVIAGSAIGLFAGFVLPRWLYYNRPQEGTGAADSGGTSIVRQMMVRPLIFDDGGGVNYSFVF